MTSLFYYIKKNIVKLLAYVAFSLSILSCSSIFGSTKRSLNKHLPPDRIYLGFMSIEYPIVVLKDSIYYVTTKFVLNNYEMIPFPPEETMGMYQVGIGVRILFQNETDLNLVPGCSWRQLGDLIERNAFVVMKSALVFEGKKDDYEIFRFKYKPEKYLIELVTDHILIPPKRLYTEKVITGIEGDTEWLSYKSNFYRVLLVPIYQNHCLDQLEIDKTQSHDLFFSEE